MSKLHDRYSGARSFDVLLWHLGDAGLPGRTAENLNEEHLARRTNSLHLEVGPVPRTRSM